MENPARGRVFGVAIRSAEHYALAFHKARRAQDLLRAALRLAVLVEHADFGFDDLARTASPALDHARRLRHRTHSLAHLLYRAIRCRRPFDDVEFRLLIAH